MESNTKDQSNDDLFAICEAYFRVPLGFCRKLGLMPKRGDYECVSSWFPITGKF